MNRITTIDRSAMQSMTDTLLAARKNNLKEVLEIAHRLETVAVVQDVAFINDSKSTNVNATFYSLECMTKPVVWIASSSDWSQDYSPLQELVQNKVKAIVCVENPKDLPAFDFTKFGVNCIRKTSLEDAFQVATSMAESGDAVLFSPAHPSEIHYDSYKERGDHFKKLIHQFLNP